MKNKGFTLIEMLAVIAILIILSLMITKQVGESINKSKEVTYNTQIEELIKVAKLYINQNNMLNDDIIIIQLDDLKNSKLLKQKKIINPKTNKEMTGCILVRYQDNKYNYEYTEDDNKCNPIIVTFDPNGGRLDKTTKKVVYNEQYGELPTPTKEGYTFMGWNGKNLFTGFVKGKRLNNNTGMESNNSTGAVSDYIPVDFSINQVYYISGLTSNLNSYTAAYNENKEFIGRTPGSAREKQILSSSSLDIAATEVEGDVRYIRVTQYYASGNSGTIDDIDSLNVQLEVGNTSTPYEPYYVTSDVTVTQENNHTLKAIWEPAS